MSVFKSMGKSVRKFFRRCCSKEAHEISKHGGLLSDIDYKFKVHGKEASPEPYVWLSTDNKYVKEYIPRGVDPEQYDHLVSLEMDPDVYTIIKSLENKKLLAPGPKNTLGIPRGYAPEINKYIVNIDIFKSPVKKLPPPKQKYPELTFLENRDRIALFMAVSKKLIKLENGILMFSKDFRLSRTTWLKTSLIWTLWRSNFGIKEGQDVIIQINLEREYLNHLIDNAISQRDKMSKEKSIIYQKDPDAKIIEPAKYNKDGFPAMEKIRTRKTIHFGIRGDELEIFIDRAYGNVKTITDIILYMVSQKPIRLTNKIYDKLNIIPTQIIVKNENGKMKRMMTQRPTTTAFKRDLTIK